VEAIDKTAIKQDLTNKYLGKVKSPCEISHALDSLKMNAPFTQPRCCTATDLRPPANSAISLVSETGEIFFMTDVTNFLEQKNQQ